MSNYVRIITGKPFVGTIPDPIVLPIHSEDPVPHSVVQTVRKGDSDYDEALNRWMYLHGYVTPDVNTMEMKTATITLKGGEGSGDFGHAGIPGHQGGSAPNHVGTEKANKLANKLYELQNAAAREYKAAFKKVGARMWGGDYAHAYKPSNRDYIANSMSEFTSEGIRKVYGFFSRPLTVLDSYPNVTRQQRRQLDMEVNKIWKRVNAEWNKFLDDEL